MIGSEGKTLLTLNDTSHAEADYKQTGLTTAYILVDI
jgi:hypothetical protein